MSRRECERDSFGTEQLLKDYLDRYSAVMDERNESKGMNNFNDIVQTLLAGRTKGLRSGNLLYSWNFQHLLWCAMLFKVQCIVVDRRSWKSGLELSQVKKLPQYQALLQEAEKYVS